MSRADCQEFDSCSPCQRRPASVSVHSVEWGTAGRQSPCSSFAVHFICSELDRSLLASLSGTSAGCSPDKTHCLQRPQLSPGRHAHPRGQSADMHQVNRCTGCCTRCTPRETLAPHTFPLPTAPTTVKPSAQTSTASTLGGPGGARKLGEQLASLAQMATCMQEATWATAGSGETQMLSCKAAITGEAKHGASRACCGHTLAAGDVK